MNAVRDKECISNTVQDLHRREASQGMEPLKRVQKRELCRKNEGYSSRYKDIERKKKEKKKKNNKKKKKKKKKDTAERVCCKGTKSKRGRGVNKGQMIR